jgi:hypothetical protein
MKKLLIFLPVMFFVTLVFPNNLSLFSDAQYVQKDINLAVFSNSNYNLPAYDDAKATIEVTISKVDASTTTILSKKTFTALQLKQYPAAASAINNKLSISGNIKNNEVLLVTYTITYDTNGSILKFQNSEVINKQTTNDDINIVI